MDRSYIYGILFLVIIPIAMSIVIGDIPSGTVVDNVRSMIMMAGAYFLMRGYVRRHNDIGRHYDDFQNEFSDDGVMIGEPEFFIPVGQPLVQNPIGGPGGFGGAVGNQGPFDDDGFFPMEQGQGPPPENMPFVGPWLNPDPEDEPPAPGG